MAKVGDTLYRLSRHHAPGQSNRWAPEVVTGETKGTWLIGNGWSRVTINKKTMLTRTDRQGVQDRYYTEQGRDGKDFIDRNAEPISHAVRYCDNVSMLRKVAIIVGCKVRKP